MPSAMKPQMKNQSRDAQRNEAQMQNQKPYVVKLQNIRKKIMLKPYGMRKKKIVVQIYNPITTFFSVQQIR